jgi:hypothetical protein
MPILIFALLARLFLVISSSEGMIALFGLLSNG